MINEIHNEGFSMDYDFLASSIAVELRRAQILAEKKFESVFGRDLLPGHLTVLVLIQNNSGSTQSAIARAAGLDRSSLVPLLKNFEERGFITRRKAENDARSNVMEITEGGAIFITEHKPKIIELEKFVETKLGKEKYNSLINLLQDFQKIVE